MAFTPIKKIIPRAIKTAGISSQINEAKILANFEEVAARIFGDQVLKKLKALYIKNGALYLACLSDVLTQRLMSQEKRFLFELNKPIGKGVIEKIRFL
jgi:hypothetical protein